MNRILPKYGFVVGLDDSGAIVQSLQDPGGKSLNLIR